MFGGQALRQLPTSPGERVKPLVAGNTNINLVGLLAWKEKTMSHRPIAAKTVTHLRVFSKSEAIDFVAAAFDLAYPSGAAKGVANDVHCSHRTTQKWVGREVAPSLHHFLTACQAVPELNAAMRGLLGMASDDPKLQRALADVVRALKP